MALHHSAQRAMTVMKEPQEVGARGKYCTPRGPKQPPPGEGARPGVLAEAAPQGPVAATSCVAAGAPLLALLFMRIVPRHHDDTLTAYFLKEALKKEEKDKEEKRKKAEKRKVSTLDATNSFSVTSSSTAKACGGHFWRVCLVSVGSQAALLATRHAVTSSQFPVSRVAR